MKSRGDFKSPGGTGPPDSPGNPKKKRRTSTPTGPGSSATPPMQPNVPDLAPPQPSTSGGYGDTIIASNPFDDMPSPPQRQMMPMGGPPPMPPMSPMGPGGNGPPPMMNPMSMSPHPPGPMNGPPGGPPHPHHMPPMSVHGGIGPPQGPGMQGPYPPGPGGPPGHPGMNNGMPPGMGGPGPNQHQWNGPPKPMPIQSGKTYPHDQPMVFNPQNRNAPPIYPCGVCHKEVHDNDQAIPCESGCNFWFHRICTGLTEAAYHFLTQEVYAEWVCDKCLSTKNIPLVKFKP